RPNENEWKEGFDEWIAVKRSADYFGVVESSFKPNQLDEMIPLNGGFSLMDANWYLPSVQDSAFITRAYKTIDLGGGEQASINYRLKVGSPANVLTFDLSFNWNNLGAMHGMGSFDTHSVSQAIHLEKDENNFKKEGSVRIESPSENTSVKINILGDGTFSEPIGSIGRLGTIYKILGDYNEKVDFPRTIMNAFDLANNSNYHQLIKQGFFKR
ncbi:MAG: hypothetical protein AABY10_04735, partial [Nanoarchaeota archaeon]